MIQKELLKITTEFNNCGISYALVGGLAVSSWVEPRATKDIDLIVSNINSEEINNRLESLGYTLNSAPMEINKIKFKRISKIMPDDDLFMVDLMQTNNDDYNHAILEGATEIKIGNSSVKIATPEDLILLKLNSIRDKDQIDVSNLKALPNLNTDYIEAWQKKLI